MLLTSLTLAKARAGLVSGTFSAEEYVEASIGAADKNNALNVYLARDNTRLTDAAKKQDDNGHARQGGCLLAGIPVALKANINTKRLPTSAGTPALADFVAGSNSAVWQVLTNAGALMAGKTNMHELAFGLTSNNNHFGAVRNPYDQSMITGGSSGGSAAAVAARIVPVALGSDTSCSVRQPAALCGVVGFRPTIGRYSQDGVFPISSTRDTIGTLARAVSDIQIIDQIIMSLPGDKSKTALSDVRLGVPSAYFFDNMDADVARVIDQTMTLLQSAGASLVEVDVGSIPALADSAGFPISLYETLITMPEYLDRYDCNISLQQIAEGISSPDVRGYMNALLGDGAIPEPVYKQAMQDRTALRSKYATLFQTHNIDALIFPTSPIAARAIGEDETVTVNGAPVGTVEIYNRNCNVSSTAGLPGITVPVGLTSAGLPVGLELDGPDGSDTRLLALAAAVEAALPPMPPP